MKTINFSTCRRFDYDQMMLEHTQILVPYCIYLVNQFKQRLVIKKHFNCNQTIQLPLLIWQNLASPRWHEKSNFIPLLQHQTQPPDDLLYHMIKSIMYNVYKKTLTITIMNLFNFREGQRDRQRERASDERAEPRYCCHNLPLKCIFPDVAIKNLWIRI